MRFVTSAQVFCIFDKCLVYPFIIHVKKGYFVDQIWLKKVPFSVWVLTEGYIAIKMVDIVYLGWP